MSLATVYEAANDATFQGRCLAACWAAANDILVEDPQTPEHARRVNWATNVLRDKAAATPRQIAVQVLRNPTIAANPIGSTDGDIQFQVNSIIATLVTLG
jgi:hypothetical protein